MSARTNYSTYLTIGIYVSVTAYLFSNFVLIPTEVFIKTVVATFIVTLFLLLTLHRLSVPRVSDSVVDKVLGSSSGVSLIAHRGGSHEAPENTLRSFKAAKKNGAYGVEFDLEFTKDGHAILLHDDTLERTTDGEGKVSDCDLKTVKKLNAASTHHLTYRDDVKEDVPTLEEAITLCLQLELKIFIDVKSNHPMAVPVLVSLFEKYPSLYDHAIVCSFYPHFLYKFRKANPHAVTALTWRPLVLTYKSEYTLEPRNKEGWKQLLAPLADVILGWSIHTWLWHVTGVSILLVSKSMCSSHYYRSWKEKGVRVIVWTVNSPVEKAFFHHEVCCSYMTDSVTNGDCGDKCVHDIEASAVK